MLYPGNIPGRLRVPDSSDAAEVADIADRRASTILNRVIPADARAGTTVGKYKLHEIVGRGGMGVVYRAEHVYIGKEVAVKILHDGYGGREESIKRFLREARAASLINHPNIVDVTDFGKSNDGTVFFVMELLHGEPLDALMQRERRLDLLRSITIVNQISGALGAAHAKGIVHRDLKPENVMLTRREGRRELIRQINDESGLHVVTEREKAFDFVKILDFGVAKVRDPNVNEGRVTQQGVVFGTPEYMAPETARIGVSDPRTDVYALGVIFYEMLTGTVPFAGETAVDVMLKVVSEPVEPPRERAPGIEITPDAEHLIMKALSKDPQKRQQSMEEFHDELERCYGSVRYRRSIERERKTATEQTPAPRRPGSNQVSGTILTPPGTPQLRSDETSSGAGSAPILLTRRKGRRKTLPMDLRPVEGTAQAAAGAVPDRETDLAARAGHDGHDEWSEPAMPPAGGTEGAWDDLDLDDAPDGTGG
jgi:eukaryotic-like serine/threonine-protein kinase